VPFQVVPQLVDLPEHLARAFINHTPEWREVHATGMALEDECAEDCLGIAQRTCQGWLRHAKQPRSLEQAALLSDRHDRPKHAQLQVVAEITLHGPCSPRSICCAKISPRDFMTQN
jgi:hypothetical protein